VILVKKFKGALAQLQYRLWVWGLLGEWAGIPNSRGHRFTSDDGEILNWWPSTGTLQVQGRNPENFELVVEAILSSIETTDTEPTPAVSRTAIEPKGQLLELVPNAPAAVSYERVAALAAPAKRLTMVKH
jgi:hypothetical protein